MLSADGRLGYVGSVADETIRKVLVAAAREFNTGRYFEAHEVIEAGLEEVPDELWDLFLALIQISVGYHKLTQGLHSGAVLMLGLGLSKLEPFAANTAGVDVGTLRQRAQTDRAALQTHTFDAAAFKLHPPRLQPLRLKPSTPSQ